MEYKVTFISMFGLTAVLLFISCLSVWLGVVSSEPFMTLIGVILFVYLLLLRIRLKIKIRNEIIEYTGLFETKSIRVCDIISAYWMEQKEASFNGPFTYKILTTEERIKINFKLFPKNCMEDILRITEGFER